ncbi:hypothetical protein ACQJBY_015707 [Aegilops geniculata]
MEQRIWMWHPLMAATAHLLFARSTVTNEDDTPNANEGATPNGPENQEAGPNGSALGTTVQDHSQVASRDVIELEGTEPNADALTVVTVDANQVVQPNGSALDNSGQDGVQVSSTDVIVLEDTEPKCWHTDYHRDRCESTYQPSWFTQCRQGSKCWHTDF